MRSTNLVFLLLLLAAGLVAAQQRAPQPPDSARRVFPPVALIPPPVPRLFPEAPPSLTDRLRLSVRRQRSRAGHALVGGLIGSAAGILVCTGISNLIPDEGSGGISTCTKSGYVGFALGGFAVGALVGALIK